MRIGLLNFTFFNENKGCEALTYSVLNTLVKEFGEDIQIVNFTDALGLGDVPKYFSSIKFIDHKKKFKDIKLSTIREIKKCDVILDVTYGDNFSDIYSENLFKTTTKTKRIVELLGIPLILMPQTIGPFKDERLLKKAVHVIKNSSKIYTRDALSADFVKRYLPQKPVFCTTDLAFGLPYEKSLYSFGTSKLRVGLNVSGLLWKGGFTKNNQFGLTLDYHEYVHKVLHYLLKKEVEVHLIPHVIDNFNGASDGDLEVCKELIEQYDECIMSPEFSNPILAKSYISNMDIFIGARMHATIAAFSSGVATIPFSYSRKFQGLYHYLDYDKIIDGCELDTKKAISLTIEYIDNFDSLKKLGASSLEIVQKECALFNKDFVSFLNQFK